MPTSAGRQPGGASPPDPREALLGLIPHLHVFARSLGRGPDEADGLVRDMVAWMLTVWHRLGPDEDLTALLAANLRERAGPARPTDP